MTCCADLKFAQTHGCRFLPTEMLCSELSNEELVRVHPHDVHRASGEHWCAQTGRLHSRRVSRSVQRRVQSSYQSTIRILTSISRNATQAIVHIPMMVSNPFIANWSLTDMGRPCKGPITFPVFRRYSSTSFALARARSTNISVRQFV